MLCTSLQCLFINLIANVCLFPVEYIVCLLWELSHVDFLLVFHDTCIFIYSHRFCISYLGGGASGDDEEEPSSSDSSGSAASLRAGFSRPPKPPSAGRRRKLDFNSNLEVEIPGEWSD